MTILGNIDGADEVFFLPEDDFETIPNRSERLEVKVGLIRSENYDPSAPPLHITGHEDVAELVDHLADADQEHMVTIALDDDGAVLAIHQVAIGVTSQLLTQTKHLVKVGLLTGADALVMVHNHPSGVPTFSIGDHVMTMAAEKGAECLGVELLDHVVVAAGRHSSYRDGGGSVMFDSKRG